MINVDYIDCRNGYLVMMTMFLGGIRLDHRFAEDVRQLPWFGHQRSDDRRRLAGRLRLHHTHIWTLRSCRFCTRSSLVATSQWCRRTRLASSATVPTWIGTATRWLAMRRRRTVFGLRFVGGRTWRLSIYHLVHITTQRISIVTKHDSGDVSFSNDS